MIITAWENASLIEIDVSDPGLGISTDNRSTLFTKFFRADNSLTHRESGAGLGHFITKYLIHTLGGAIRVPSKEGVGSTLSFTVPQPHLGMPSQVEGGPSCGRLLGASAAICVLENARARQDPCDPTVVLVQKEGD